MKKCLLLFLLTGLFAFTIIAQNNEVNTENDSLFLDSNAFVSQLKEQLRTQLKAQLESQLKTGFDSLSKKELNHVIDSMVVVLDGVIKQSKNISEDSLETAYKLLSGLNFRLNDQDMGERNLLEKEDIMEFYESMTSQSVKMRKELLSIKKIRNKDMKAQRLSDSFVNFMNESGLWKILDKMLNKMMPQ